MKLNFILQMWHWNTDETDDIFRLCKLLNIQYEDIISIIKDFCLFPMKSRENHRFICVVVASNLSWHMHILHLYLHAHMLCSWNSIVFKLINSVDFIYVGSVIGGNIFVSVVLWRVMHIIQVSFLALEILHGYFN